MSENIVYYSYKISRHSHINDHEMRRLDHSINSLREFNNEIPVYLFCDDPSIIPDHFILEYAVRVEPIEKQPNHVLLFIYMRFKLQ